MSYLRLFHTDSSTYRALSVFLIDNVYIPFRLGGPKMHCSSTLAQVLGPCVNFRGHDTFHLTLGCKLGVVQKLREQVTSECKSFTEDFTLAVSV